jgi:hypothetical protein
LADDDLLRPTLSGSGEPPSLYSSTGFFLSSFFGGPVAAGIYGLVNSHRLGRLQRDLLTVLVIVATGCWLLLFVEAQGGLARLGELMGDRPARTAEIAIRAVGLACFGAIYLLHRQHYRAAQITGAESIPGWVPGIGAVVAGIAANVYILGRLTGHH